MRYYRIYVLCRTGHVFKPPQIIECEKDQVAIDKAIEQNNHLSEGFAIEVWEQQRLVTRLEPRRAVQIS